jgi:hypothetical protein
MMTTSRRQLRPPGPAPGGGAVVNDLDAKISRIQEQRRALERE